MSDTHNSDSDFLEFEPESDAAEPSPFDVEFLDASPEPEPPVLWHRLPSPGILGAIGWSALALILHLIGGVVALAIVLSMAIAKNNIPPEEVNELAKDEESLMALMGQSPGVLLGAEMVTFLVGVLALTLYYYRANLRAALPLQTPRWQHVLLILAWFMPLSIFCSQLGVWASIGWSEFASNIPQLAPFKEFKMTEEVSRLTEHLSFGAMLFLIAIVPAIAEELIFRGIIGRGLLARFGVAGILLTTIFFAGVHMHPVHVIAVVPLSIAIHWGYLATRNLWIPMLAHFLNNSWAVVIMYATKHIEDEPTEAILADEAFLPLGVTLSALVCSLAIGWLIWEMRTIYLKPDRERWELPFLSTDRPPAELGCTAVLTRPSVASIAAGALGMILFWGLFVSFVVSQAGQS
ncbi:MAG TPA: CPBP family intramembrane glutamic endopeptidase [Planctomycetaceae bacterium]|nr:CPBP family intramembrane glutamic endopeptidase [Planctomycetaceae bacterium]